MPYSCMSCIPPLFPWQLLESTIVLQLFLYPGNGASLRPAHLTDSMVGGGGGIKVTQLDHVESKAEQHTRVSSLTGGSPFIEMTQ